ncbi:MULTISPECIES: YpjP family protein [Sporosarcina]|uniref:YpjP family protein n=1 Tax=Sporosarcina contaminans TaxID=633403 RepID=A0ABW3U088_9BACL
MKKYYHKLLIAVVAVLTLGVISPSHEIWTNLEPKDNERATNEHGTDHALNISLEDEYFDHYTWQEPVSLQDELLNSAKELSYQKFGSRIGPVIQNDFDEIIFPKIEEVIQAKISQVENRKLAITETPSGAYSEKIFHVSDMEDGKALIKFHVRTEKRPQDGYFYNFHYHTAEDGFLAHHSLGDIYWSKNTPPKWLS